MMTLRQLAAKPETIPLSTTWYLSDLGEAHGKQELFTRQVPQRLKALKQQALIESTVSSNRIEGVEIDPARVELVLLKQPALRDRNEEELRGYRDALQAVHERSAKLAFSEQTIKRLHRQTRGEIWDAGKYKELPVDIIETLPGGRQRVRFATVTPKQTPAAMAELVELWQRAQRERWVPLPISLAAANLDFLCIHPFRDGNGRVSRLLWLLLSYHIGLEVGRYISLERLIEQNKDRYYETLEHSSRGWHEGRHDPWPYINFVLYTLLLAYREFEERVGRTDSPKGEKTAIVQNAIRRSAETFSVADLQRNCPGISLDLIRHVLKSLRKNDSVECLGRGPKALWRKTKRFK
ncbi:MAG: Fic family protein [Planctomycetaceae bacterium]